MTHDLIPCYFDTYYWIQPAEQINVFIRIIILSKFESNRQVYAHQSRLQASDTDFQGRNVTSNRKSHDECDSFGDRGQNTQLISR